MSDSLKTFISESLSQCGDLELDLEKTDHSKSELFYSLSMNEFNSENTDLGVLDINTYYSKDNKITYSLEKRCFPICINSKENLKKIINLIIDTDLNFAIEVDKIKKNSDMFWDRYFLSISIGKTTKISELIAMVGVIKNFLLKVEQNDWR